MNKKEIKEIINTENIFYTAIIGVFYLIGVISIFKNIAFSLKYIDLDHFVYVSLSAYIWVLFGFIYIEKLKYFAKIKPLKDEQYLLKPKNDFEHMIWFFIQIYILISFFMIFIVFHNNIENIFKNKDFLTITLYFCSFLPFLNDAIKINKKYFIQVVIFLMTTVFLISIGFFESGCYSVSQDGLTSYNVDCKEK